MNVLVTGGSGFVGSSVAAYLANAGYKVSILVRSNSNLWRLGEVESKIRIGRCDGKSEVHDFIGKTTPDIVIHTACCFGRSNEKLVDIYDSNISFGLIILESILTNCSEVTFINAGTALPPDFGLYSLTKHQFSQLGRILASKYKDKLRFVNLRLHNIYGERDDASKFATFILRSCANNCESLDLTEGFQERDFIHISDVVSAFNKIMENLSGLDHFSEFEIGTGTTTSVRHFVETAHRITKSKTLLNFGALETQYVELVKLQAETSLIRSFGWTPKYDIESGLARMFLLERL